MNRFRDWYRARVARPLILAHRGDSFRAPENTLEAARLGHEAGADGWELDVQLTRDGVPIVLHDESLLRTTDVARCFAGDPRSESGFLVTDLTLDEVRQLDAGSWFLEPSGEPRSAAGFGSVDRIDPADRDRFASGSVRIPTLAEALELTGRLDWLVNIEIKPTGSDLDLLVDLVLAEVRAAGVLDRSTISSFDHRVVAEVARREPSVATGALVLGPVDCSADGLLASVGADAIHGPPSCLGWAGESCPLLVYTVNDARPGGLAARLTESGVAGIFTDDPVSMVRLLRLRPF